MTRKHHGNLKLSECKENEVTETEIISLLCQTTFQTIN